MKKELKTSSIVRSTYQLDNATVNVVSHFNGSENLFDLLLSVSKIMLDRGSNSAKTNYAPGEKSDIISLEARPYRDVQKLSNEVIR